MENKTYQFGSIKDEVFANKVSAYLNRVYESIGLKSVVGKDVYFECWRITFCLPEDHNPDYLIGIVDGIINQYRGLD